MIIGENEQKKSLGFDWFMFCGGGNHPAINSLFPI
jgi:hypothetical protein